jgi:hypothetical protein
MFQATINFSFFIADLPIVRFYSIAFMKDRVVGMMVEIANSGFFIWFVISLNSGIFIWLTFT